MRGFVDDDDDDPFARVGFISGLGGVSRAATRWMTSMRFSFRFEFLYPREERELKLERRRKVWAVSGRHNPTIDDTLMAMHYLLLMLYTNNPEPLMFNVLYVPACMFSNLFSIHKIPQNCANAVCTCVLSPYAVCTIL